MYTVVRFRSASPDDPNLPILGEQLNRIRPGMYNGVSKRQNGFSCSIIDTGHWTEHTAAITEFLRDCRTVIRRAQQLGFVISFDTAIWPEELRGRNLLGWVLEPDFITTLAKSGAELEFSCYSMANPAAPHPVDPALQNPHENPCRQTKA